MPLSEIEKFFSLVVCSYGIYLYSINPDSPEGRHSGESLYLNHNDAKEYANQLWDFFMGNNIENYH